MTNERELRDLAANFNAASAALHLALNQPNCRVCEHFVIDPDGMTGCTKWQTPCTDGDKFQAAEPVKLYRVMK